MKLIKHTNPTMIISEEGKHIRSVNDVYEPEHTNEDGMLVPEHFPHYSTVLFVPSSTTEEQMNQLYVEEDI